MGHPVEKTVLENFSVDSTAADSNPFNVEDFSQGVVYVPAGESISSFVIHAAPTESGTYLPLDDSGSTAVSHTVAAGQCIALNEAVFGAAWVKIVPNADGTVHVTLSGK